MPLKKMRIWAYRDASFKDPVGDPIWVAINPDEYSHSQAVEYNCAAAQGASAKSVQFNQMGRERVSFTLWFDGTGVVPEAPVGKTTSIDSQISAFRKTVIAYDGEVHRPNFLKVTWGTLKFNCSLEKLDITYTMFTPQGEPIRAKCAVSLLRSVSPRDAKTEAQPSSPDMSHVIVVRAGDTLPLLCHRVYGSSIHYTKVARFNRLGSFRALTPGMQLLFPRIDHTGR